MSFKEAINSAEENRSVIAFNLGKTIFPLVEDMIDDDDEFTQEAADTANEKVEEFIASLSDTLGGNIESNFVIGPVEECLIPYEAGCLNRTEWNFEEVFLYGVLTKSVDADVLDQAFLSMEDYGFEASIKDLENDQRVRQNYDFGEYDTGYFSDDQADHYIDDESDVGEYFDTAEEMLLGEDVE